MQQFFSLLSWRLFTAQHVSGVLPPIIKSSMTAVAASGFAFVSWWQSCCVRVRGRAGRPARPRTHIDNRLVCSLIQTCTLNSHLYRVTYTKCLIDTINSPDDEHMAARNMYRIEINIHENELCLKLVIYKDCTEKHSQQNTKCCFNR
jgi:hypothetical protein